MKQSQAIIERIRRVNAAYQHLEIAVDEAVQRIKAGQSLLARLTDGWSPYLREHWWPVGAAGNHLIIERPGNIAYEPGQVVDLLGPVGQPFRFRRTLRNVLFIAYDTPPTPLLMTIPALLGNNVSVSLALLGTARDYHTGHLPAEVEILRGDDDLHWPNQVMTFGWADQIFVTVHPYQELENFNRIIQLIQNLRADVPKSYVFGVFQHVLPCGVGACHACMLQTLDGLKLACQEGPAFDLTRVVLS